MPGTFDKENWKGKALLDKIELFSFFLFYTIIIVVPFIIGARSGGQVGIQVIIWIFVGLAFYVVIFVAIQQYVYRMIADQYNGIPVMSGWMDQEEDLGEEYEFRIEKITPFERLSEAEKETCKEFIELEAKRLVELREEGSEMDYLLEYQILEEESHDRK